jgi:hypothetical protein
MKLVQVDAERDSVTTQMEAVCSSEMSTRTLNIYGRENPKKHIFLGKAVEGGESW